jgi:hypothetical protein
MHLIVLVCWLRGGILSRWKQKTRAPVFRLARQERFRIQNGLSGCGSAAQPRLLALFGNEESALVAPFPTRVHGLQPQISRRQ